MKIIVQKFGGTSVRDEDGRKNALRHIKGALDEGYKSVVVVSAMGRMGDPYATDTLLSLVGHQRSLLTKREQDLLMSCGENISAVVFSQFLKEHGMMVEAFTGGQAGLITNSEHTNARILELKSERIMKALEDNDVVVVTGFQGVNLDGDVTTLGRGGSDTSASVMGVIVHADRIDIFTDVEGIMTADPRVVSKAKILDTVTYDEVCNLAQQGAKVIHPRAVEIAAGANIPIRVRSTYSDSLGTLIISKDQTGSIEKVNDRLITGIAHVGKLTQIKVSSKNSQYDLPSQVFKAMANGDISVDFINISPSGVIYTVSDDVSDKAIEILRNLGYEPMIIRECAKIAIVGAAITGVPGVTSKIVTALSQHGISILQSADSHTTIWVLVKESDLQIAVNALHQAFTLT